MQGNFFWQSLLDLIFPQKEGCPLCGTKSPGEKVCPDCREILLGSGRMPFCRVCGRFWQEKKPGREEVCRFCRQKKPAFDLARAVAPYRGAIGEAVLRLKTGGSHRLAAALGELVAEIARRTAPLARTDLIIPVPLTPRSQARRGFNQAELLAREVGSRLEFPVETRAVVKIRETKRQAGLPREERIYNLTGAFAVTRPEKIHGKNILIIDDVFTTGSTADNISLELRKYQAGDVYVLTVAGGLAISKKEQGNDHRR